MSGYQHLLVPLDPDGAAWDVVHEAARLARALEARVTLLHVLDLPEAPSGPSTGTTVGQLLLQQAHRALDDLAALVPGGAATVVRVGETVPTVLAAVADLHADMVVCGTHGRTGLSRMLLGSVAEEILRRCPVPVLVVRQGDARPDRPAEAWLQAEPG